VPTRNLGIASLDIWPSPISVISGAQETRLKFGVQYDNVSLGCAWLECSEPVITLEHEQHIEIFRKNVGVVISHLPTVTPEQYAKMPDSIPRNDLNRWLIGVGAASTTSYLALLHGAKHLGSASVVLKK
jgi:hypothetical protein